MKDENLSAVPEQAIKTKRQLLYELVKLVRRIAELEISETKLKHTKEEKERIQAQLIQSEKMAGVSTLADGIAHEFNNLLQIINGHVQFAQKSKNPEDIEEAFSITLKTSDRAAKIVKDLVAFSRQDASKKELCDITEPIESVLSLTEDQLKKHNIEVVRKYGTPPQIEVNKAEMQQVFLDMVSFTDTGKGIEEKNLRRVFEPFYTTKGTAGEDSKLRGIGLGLSVSYGIVKRHGGTIEVESEAGNGTTFTIKLPVKEGKSKERCEEKIEMENPEVLNILVVDDEEEICKMFEKWLSLEGYRAQSALTGKKAINLVKKEHFDVVFLDIIIPGTTAFEVLERIKKISPETKVVIITGKLMNNDLSNELRQKGASAFLQKPFKAEDIMRAIKMKR
jgi:nitrogen-specific signal transduction histidine kinase/CheY-like chemotaxis protein